MQSNKHKQADPLASSDDLAKRVGPLSVAQEIFKYDGITVRDTCTGVSCRVSWHAKAFRRSGCIRRLIDCLCRSSFMQQLPPVSPASASFTVYAMSRLVHVVQGFWKGVLPSLVMVCNPTVQYVLFEWLLARIREARTKAGRKGSAVAPTGFQVGSEQHLHMLRLNCYMSRRQTVLDSRVGGVRLTSARPQRAHGTRASST